VAIGYEHILLHDFRIGIVKHLVLDIRELVLITSYGRIVLVVVGAGSLRDEEEKIVKKLLENQL